MGAVVGIADGSYDVVDEDLEVHFGLAAQTLDVGHEVALVGTDGAAEGVVIVKGGAEAERKNGGLCEAAGDDAGVVAGRCLCGRDR